MATVQTINLGNLVNDGLGDDLRTSFAKVNSNFSAIVAEYAVTGKNIGTSGVGVFKQKTDYELELKKLVGTSNLTVTDSGDTITFASPLQNAFTSITTSNGVVTATSPTGALTFQGGDNITVTRTGSTVIFEAQLLDTLLRNNLDLHNFDIIGIGNINIAGSITADNYIGDIRGTSSSSIVSNTFDFNFGKVANGPVETVTEFILSMGDYDFGTCTDPAETELDLGTII